MMNFDPNKLLPCDILCVRSSCLLPFLVRFFTDGIVNHVALYYGDGKVINVRKKVVIEELKDLDSSRTQIWAVRVKELTPIKMKRVLDWCMSRVDSQYDYLQLVGILFAILLGKKKALYDNRVRYVCSEFIAEAFESVGIHFIEGKDVNLITPMDILMSQEVEIIR